MKYLILILTLATTAVNAQSEFVNDVTEMLNGHVVFEDKIDAYTAIEVELEHYIEFSHVKEAASIAIMDLGGKVHKVWQSEGKPHQLVQTMYYYVGERMVIMTMYYTKPSGDADGFPRAGNIAFVFKK